MPPAVVLPPPPKEVPRVWSLDGLAPAMRRAIEGVLADVEKERVFETLRTNERQEWLYGFGREYDDGRAVKGPVTNARTAMDGWHVFGLAVDIVEDDATPWVASTAFWQSLGLAYERHGCVWGGRWHRVDLPHGQWGGCTVKPDSYIRQAYQSEGVEAVWGEVSAW
jgi:hypothetical protein